MEAAVGAANWLLGKLLIKLSDDFVAEFVASSELGHNFESIKLRLQYTLGLLHAAQGRDMTKSPNPGLQGMLAKLSKKADEAEDLLDEIHYFIIQDKLDGTSEATVEDDPSPQIGDVLRGHARDGRHAIRHIIGNWLLCCYCSPTQDDDSASAAASNPRNAAMSSSGNDGRPVDKLPFSRVAMSTKIKSVIEEMIPICEFVSDLLKIPNHSSTITSTSITLKRPTTGSTPTQDKLFGRSAIFEQTVNALTGGMYHTETLSVLPLVGPGGIGKTAFSQHLYNDERIVGHFTVRVWICVSTDFDVLNLNRQILRCIPAIEKQEHKCTIETANLDQLQKSIAERLKSKRFLIVLDDIWKCNNESDWNNLLAPFKKGDAKGSMVLVTTRFPSIAHFVKTTDPIELHGLEPNDIFEFFKACIFGHSKLGHYENDLIDVGRDIAKKLKGSPLAANTVGRLLKKNLSLEYWLGVLEKNEWQNTKYDDDIMPSLKISYDYLPFLLKKCFSYCALFPEDYKFYNLEITSFLTAIGILDSSCQDDKNYLEELVDNGFLMKGSESYYGQYYVMHDLMHELSRNVSAQECFNIKSSSFSADDVPQSVQHLSITIENIYDDNFEEEMERMKGIIDIGNLRTLMIFGLYEERIANVCRDTFEELRGLRVLYIAMNNPESLPKSFPKLIHLQYLKIRSLNSLEELTLPSTLSRFYHLKFLDLKEWYGSPKLPNDICRLVNLCHFHSSYGLHSNIPEVGKMKCLQELEEFCVKKESIGFELRELGELEKLGGKLCISNLETVVSKREASVAKLKNKKNLKELRLVWSTEHQTIDDDVLDGLQPHPNLRELYIINAGVAPCPRWLCGDICTKRLETLYLEGLSWCTLPALEQLPHLTSLTLRNIARMRMFGPGFSGVTERSFMNLKTIVFKDMPELEEWVGEPKSNLFSRLERIKLEGCPLLYSFPFLECSGCFTNLCELDIIGCPKLSQFPAMPQTSTLSYIHVQERGPRNLFYTEKYLHIHGYNSALIFHNMHNVEVIVITDFSQTLLSNLQMQNSLRCLELSVELAGSVVLHSVQNLRLEGLSITGETFSKVLKCFPALSQLTVIQCKSLELPVVGGLSALKMLESFIGSDCGKMFSRWPMEEVSGGAHAIKPFPSSLRGLAISSESSMKSMGLLSNLTSLTNLRLTDCEELTMDGFNPLITVNLKKLTVYGMDREQGRISIAGDMLTEIAESKLMHAGSFQLEEFLVDSVSAVLTAPICTHLATTLHILRFLFDQSVKSFTEEQEKALMLLTSLQRLQFQHCMNLQSLPQGLHRLSSLKILEIFGCHEIQCMPPKEGLPTSLETLHVEYCSTKLTEQAKKLKGTDPWFKVKISVPSTEREEQEEIRQREKMLAHMRGE
ncbi:putative disease resistance protein RGA3 [Triticum dicoccoides]|uniref:putative disease resistance protein RGA3 n=1 Tax=Triticum dicoccoides TaxID=85692 RepID=UPI00189181EC|nr:putative disease resistance protein RGA3 [Triticum dicoccoides]